MRWQKIVWGNITQDMGTPRARESGGCCGFEYAHVERFTWEVLWGRTPEEGEGASPAGVWGRLRLYLTALHGIICSLSGISVLDSTLWPPSLLLLVFFYSQTPTVLASDVDRTFFVLSLSLLRSSLPFKSQVKLYYHFLTLTLNYLAPSCFSAYLAKPQPWGNLNCLLHCADSPSPNERPRTSSGLSVLLRNHTTVL